MPNVVPDALKPIEQQIEDLEANSNATPAFKEGLEREFKAMVDLYQGQKSNPLPQNPRPLPQGPAPRPVEAEKEVAPPEPPVRPGNPVEDKSVAPAPVTLDDGEVPGPNKGPEKLTRNAGGVLQAPATEGISPASVKVKSTGPGADKTYNVTNATSRTESFTYSDRTGAKMTMTLAPGQTGTFQAPSERVGVRIAPSDPQGDQNPNEVLDEDGATIAPDGDPNAIQPKTLPTGNQDISKVDGDDDYYGNHMNMTVTLSNGRTGGDGDLNHAYAYSTDDHASMDLAGDPSKTANIVMSDKNDIQAPT